MSHEGKSQCTTTGKDKKKATELFCLLQGENMPFSVEIGLNQYVSQLKKAIKAEKYLTLRDLCEANLLNLWRISISRQDITEFDQNFNQENSDWENMHSLEKIEDYFTEGVEEKRIHIFVEVPRGMYNF